MPHGKRYVTVSLYVMLHLPRGGPTGCRLDKRIGDCMTGMAPRPDPAQGGAAEAGFTAMDVVATARQPMALLDGDLRVVAANAGFLRLSEVAAGPVEGQSLYTLGDGRWKLPALQDLLENILPERRAVEGFRLEIGERSLVADARCIMRDGQPRQILLAVEEREDKAISHRQLREIEAQLAAVVRNSPVGIGVVDANGEWLIASPSLRPFTRGSMPSRDDRQAQTWQALDSTGRPLPRSEWPGARALRGEVVAPGIDFRTVVDGQPRWARVSAAPVPGDPEFPHAVVIVEDVTAAKQIEEALRRSEERQSFLLTLSDAIRRLGDPVEVQASACEVLGKYLGASRVGYAEDLGDGERVAMTRDYTDRVSSIIGVYRYRSFGPSLVGELRAGRTVVRPDIPGDPLLTAAEKAAHVGLEVAATLNVPLVKSGRLVAILTVHYAEPHDFPPEEVALCEEVAERTWAAVERARAEAALRRSEARYRLLFDSIDQGFCVIEMIFDERERPVDYRFLQVNSAFERQTGLRDPVGRTMRELEPQQEDEWFEIYGQVALTGEPARFERAAEALGRHFEVLAFRIGPAGERRLGILFNEISERIRTDQYQQMLMAELDHRVKNVLAVVKSIAVQTLRGSDREAGERFVGRIAALARSHSILAANRWKGADLRGLVAEAVAPHDTADGASRLSLNGPAIKVMPKVAQALALAFHELSTNAAKYGALSTATGRVEVAWTADADALAKPRLLIDWRETGGPLIQGPPARRGFGSSLIERTLTYEFGGKVTSDFHPSGLAVRLELPLAAVAAPDLPEADCAAPAAVARAVPDAGPLAGSRVLVVEDQHFIALEMEQILRDAGCEVVGPAASLAEARRLLHGTAPAAAVLDINLGNEMVWPLALELHARRIPMVFATGYAATVKPPPELIDIPRLGKPVAARDLLPLVASII